MSISIVRGTQLSALFLFGLMSGQAVAADGTTTYGIGAGASGNGATIYFPIRTGSLIVEPHISYFHNEDATDGAGTDVSRYPPSQQLPDDTTPVTTSQKYTYERMEIGLGVFSKNQIADEIELYYGGRFGYQTDERRNQRSDEYSAGGGTFVQVPMTITGSKQGISWLQPSGCSIFHAPIFHWALRSHSDTQIYRVTKTRPGTTLLVIQTDTLRRVPYPATPIRLPTQR